MTPLSFEAEYGARWIELEGALNAMEGMRVRDHSAQADAARVAALYRAACEQLALARARDYPAHLVERLERLTERAHQTIYHRRERGAARLVRLLAVEMPCAVRAHARYLLVAALVFVLPLLATGLATWRDPGFALMLHDANTLREYERMYGQGTDAVGRLRSAGTDFEMFGFYIYNNIGIGFRTFASGLFFGVGSLFVLAFNGIWGGAVAGYLTARGLGGNFFAFVVTHGAFELTAIVLSGAAGLALGHALLAPGRRTRATALRDTAHALVPILYAVFVMLLVAAAVEAFWSSARWVPHEVKYGVGAACWLLVLVWLGWMGRPARAPGATHAH